MTEKFEDDGEFIGQFNPEDFTANGAQPSEPEDFAHAFNERIAVGEPENRKEKIEPLRLLRFSDFFGTEPPPRSWIIPNWIPAEGEVTLFYGDGGVGKSFMAMQLQFASAMGQKWFGLEVEPIRSVGIYCEDNEKELHRRVDRITRGCSEPEEYARSAMTKASFVSRIGEDNLLMVFTKSGKGEVTPFQKQIVERALDEKARLVTLDNAATLFPGSAIDPSQVRRFVDVACGGIASKIGGAVMLLAHPSQSAMRSGDGGGFGVQWNAAARSRLYTEHVKGVDGKSDPQSLILSRKKGNYADVESAAEIRLRWERGVLVRDTPNDAESRPPVEEVFLTLLDKFAAAGRNVSDKSRAGNYAPAEFAKEKDRHGYRVPDFDAAMRSLFDDATIALETYGRPSEPRTRIVRRAESNA